MKTIIVNICKGIAFAVLIFIAVVSAFVVLNHCQFMDNNVAAYAAENEIVQLSDMEEDCDYKVLYGQDKEHYGTEVLDECYKNISRSEKYYNEIRHIFVVSEKDEIYSDCYAGVFYDQKGILNVGLTEMDDKLIQQYEEVHFIQQLFSYNYLCNIQNALYEIMTLYDIQSISVDIIDNEIEICLTKDDYVVDIVSFLKKKMEIFEGALKFIIDDNNCSSLVASTAYGGDDIYRNISNGTVHGTICVNAVNNATKDIGVLTNYHVAPSGEAMYYGGYFDGAFHYGIGTGNLIGYSVCGQQSGSVDASFVKYSNQEGWESTACAEYNTTNFNNIRLGNDSQLVLGAPIKKIGNTSGITDGYLTAVSKTEMVDNTIYSNIIEFTNTTMGGDSGGPVYYNDGTTLWLVGMTFAGANNGTGFGCKISNVMSVLNITPITNDNYNSIEYKAKLNKQGGVGGTDAITVTYGNAMPSASAPSRSGYRFGGYRSGTNGGGTLYYKSDMQSANKWYMRRSATLYAQWTPITYSIIVLADSLSQGSGIANAPSSISAQYGSTYQFTASEMSGWEFQYWTINDEWYSNSASISVQNLTTVEGELVCLCQWYKKKSCVAEGSMITLADGSQVAVENLTGNENLLVWNMLTGQFDSAPILFVDSDPSTAYEVIKLTFSDGTEVKVIDEHAFFDMDLGEYIFLRSDAAQYIGHYFNKQSYDNDNNMIWTSVQLTDVDVYTEVTTAWSPVTYGHLCYYVNGMLSMPGATEGFINIFDVDETLMQYDTAQMAADIQTYGLYTYEEFNAIIPLPELVFDAFCGQYLKVSVGKGLITLQEIVALLERYSGFFE